MAKKRTEMTPAEEARIHPKWDEFWKWARANGAASEHEEDWLAWWECWIDGFEAGRKYLAPPDKPKKKKKESNSRPARWARACSDASEHTGPLKDSLEELHSIWEEYENWKDGLPENLQSSGLSDKLEQVCDLDVASAVQFVDEIESLIAEAEGLDLPRGFGRD